MERLGTWSCQMTTRNDVQILAVINVTLNDFLERSVVDSAGFLTATETFGPTVMNVSVWVFGRVLLRPIST